MCYYHLLNGITLKGGTAILQPLIKEGGVELGGKILLVKKLE